MRSRGVPWVLACAFGDGTRRRRGENGTAEDPGTVRQRVECLDLISFRRNPECFRRHLKKPRGIVEVKPRFDSVVSRLIDGNAVIGSQRGDTLARPAIAIAGHQPVPVQDAGDEIVVSDQHQLAYGGNHIGRGAGALPAPPPGQAYLGVDPANPMDEQNDIDTDAAEIGLLVHWVGGVHTEIRLPRRRRGQRTSTSADVIAAVRQLVLIANDDLIAGILNRNGLVTGYGNRWTRERVTSLRSHHGIAVHKAADDGIEPWLNLNNAARLLRVAPRTLRVAAEAGEIEALHPLPDGPWVFSRAVLSTAPARAITERARQSPRHPAGLHPDQQ